MRMTMTGKRMMTESSPLGRHKFCHFERELITPSRYKEEQ